MTEENLKQFQLLGIYAPKGKKNRSNFLLSFFDEEDGYKEMEINDFHLVKWNLTTGKNEESKWVVSVFMQDDFLAYLEYKKEFETNPKKFITERKEKKQNEKQKPKVKNKPKTNKIKIFKKDQIGVIHNF